MSVDLLKFTRDKAGLTQKDMALAMGLGISAYQDIETGFDKFKPRHLLALERVSLRLACERGDLNIALPSVRRDALEYAKLLEHGARRTSPETYLNEEAGS